MKKAELTKWQLDIIIGLIKARINFIEFRLAGRNTGKDFVYDADYRNLKKTLIVLESQKLAREN